LLIAGDGDERGPVGVETLVQIDEHRRVQFRQRAFGAEKDDDHHRRREG
jgi:hypothetical protein